MAVQGRNTALLVLVAVAGLAAVGVAVYLSTSSKKDGGPALGPPLPTEDLTDPSLADYEKPDPNGGVDVGNLPGGKSYTSGSVTVPLDGPVAVQPTPDQQKEIVDQLKPKLDDFMAGLMR